MIRSMTGYGAAEIDTPYYTIKAEIKSLNSKFFELNLRLPRTWQSKELELRSEVSKLIERGSCQLNINVVFKNAKDIVQPVNKDVAVYYLTELSDACKKAGVDPAMIGASIFDMPALFQPLEQEANDEDSKNLLHVFNQAFVVFEKFRQKEGDILSAELTRMTQAILQLLGDVDKLDPVRVQSIKQKIETDLSQLKEDNIDKNRFEQELIYYIEKFDISEEKSRLKQHCIYFLETMKLKSSGKKLGFIAQEMGREINTIGSKANDYKMQQRVVEMKDELEKIKEQINNIL
jgi:uncharacterized protein (TIGR00255 family)